MSFDPLTQPGALTDTVLISLLIIAALVAEEYTRPWRQRRKETR